MGLEAGCSVRVGGKTSSGKALLESDVLIFRGDFRLQIAFASMGAVSVEGDALVVRCGDLEARFELGAAVADRWARRLKEPKTLFQKLGIAPDVHVAVAGTLDPVFVVALRERAASVVKERLPEGVPVILFGAETCQSLKEVQHLRTRMMDRGALWIVRPKGSKHITERDVFEAARGVGLVDTKVVAFSKTHTAHKWVVPLERRETVPRRAPAATVQPSARRAGRMG